MFVVAMGADTGDRVGGTAASCANTFGLSINTLALMASKRRLFVLPQLVADVLSLYGWEPDGGASRITGKAMNLDVTLAPGLPDIEGDPTQLRQVIHNLLQNAQDACEVRGQCLANARVQLRTEWRAQRQRVRLTVTDTGPGFAPHILQRAFEPYVTTKAKGTGLGLAVVKKIADEHGARIDMANVQEGDNIQGAQVSLSFAVAQTAQGLEQPPS